MKKIIAVIIFFSIIFSFSAYAEEHEPLFNKVNVHINVVPNGADKGQLHMLRYRFDLYDGSSNELLDTRIIEMTSADNATPTYFDLSFNTPEYEIGKVFILHMSQGDAEITFDSKTGAYFLLHTYSTPNANASSLIYCNSFYMELRPAPARVVNLYLDGEKRTDLALYTYPQGILISAKALSALGISSSTAADGGIFLSKANVSLLLYPDQLCAYKNSKAFNLSLAPTIINGEPYVPVGDTAALFGCKTDYSDDGCTLNLSLGYSSIGRTNDEERLISLGKKSDTNYLIWVSKSEYSVRIYKGGEGSWHRINSFPCAIGAPSTPTCEGTYKYYQYQTRWEYPTYYVGPIMRFNGGYAIHSTLLRYNGTNADNRVGVKISHGCVRVRPEGINWMAKNIPLYTTVYITP